MHSPKECFRIFTLMLHAAGVLSGEQLEEALKFIQTCPNTPMKKLEDKLQEARQQIKDGKFRSFKSLGELKDWWHKEH